MGEGGVHVELLPVFEVKLVHESLDLGVDVLQPLLFALFRRLLSLVLGAQGDGAHEEGRRQHP
ncbi:MAG: hypothetical protein IKD95_06025 [Bacteroidales bacterium]|nr:hypothetical protein [Bacteroidales bacterium]